MPTFTALALDRLLEVGESKSMAAVKNVPDSRLERKRSTSSSMLDRRTSVPPMTLEKSGSLPSPKPESKSGPSAMTLDRSNTHWTKISPALYATPKTTPIPDSPSSYPPSPYIINHKRRGPRLLKSYSEDDVATIPRTLDKQKEAENAKNSEKDVASVDDSSILREAIDSEDDNQSKYANLSLLKEELFSGTSHCIKEEHSDVNGTLCPVKEHGNVNHSLDMLENVNGYCNAEFQGFEIASSSAGEKELVHLKQIGEVGNISDSMDLMNVKSNAENNANGEVEQSMNLTTPAAEFYDAWEELFSDGTPQAPVPDIEAELREIRLSLLMEIEKRKQAEETMNNMRTQWRRIQSQLSSVGLTLPADPLAVADNEQLDDPTEELSRQVYLVRFVSNSIGRGAAKAEVEMEMTAQLKLKNFEIARLWDKLHYYEAVNREMSQRNQEAVDTARRLRQKRKRRQRWVWGTIAATITLGSAVLAWPYLSTGKGTSSTNQSHGSHGDHA